MSKRTRFVRVVPQVLFVSVLMDEPGTSEVVVMLDALPPEDVAVYAEESNLVDWTEKSAAIQADIE